MTLVLQSTRPGDVPAWLTACLGSVKRWSDVRGYHYRLIGDELFDPLPAIFRDKTAGRLPMAADLARLLWIRRLLEDGAGRVVWFDADTLVFDPAGLILPEGADHAFGREIWVQRNLKGGLRVYRNVHNAVCLFAAGNMVLDFLIQASRSIVERADGPALDLLCRKSPSPPAAANLCASMLGRDYDDVAVTPALFDAAIAAPMRDGSAMRRT